MENGCRLGFYSDATMDKVPEGWETDFTCLRTTLAKTQREELTKLNIRHLRRVRNLNEEYDMLIVIDANMSVNGDLNDFVDTYCMSSMDGVFLIHPSIDNAYEDIDLCAEVRKGRARYFVEDI